jgi:hypothetical protein
MSNYTIANNCNVPLNLQTGTIPNMRDTMADWFQYLIFAKVTKTTEAFQVVETMTEISFWGTIQPLNPRELKLLPEGERAWSYFQIHAQSEPGGALISLNVDDVGIFLGKQTRVMSRKDYALYSYTELVFLQDWTGSGPAVVS